MASTPLATMDQFDNAQLLMDVVDTVRHARFDDERLMAQIDSDEDLIAHVRNIYQSQGIAVDEATVRQGLELMKSQRFEFKAPRPSVALKLANLYVTRSAWGPRFLVRTAAAFTLSAVAIGSYVGISAYRFNSWMDGAAESLKAETFVRSKHGEFLASANALPATPRPVADGARQAKQSLNEAERSLVTVPALPATKDEQEALYERDTTAARQLLDQREAVLRVASKHVGNAKQALGDVAALQVAYKGVAAFDQPTPSYLTSLRDSLKLQFENAANTGNASGMDAAVRTFENALSLDSKRLVLLSQVNGLTGSQVGVLAGILTETQGLLTAGNLAAAQTHLDDVTTKLAILPLTYTLRIVSEAGERSGVWRYYDNNKNARSYYIVVDAIDASGAPVKLPITSAEDKEIREVSRFAIRVPEHVYQGVGKDKQEDGIVDNDQFGHKAAGELDTKYEFETLGGMITTW